MRIGTEFCAKTGVSFHLDFLGTSADTANLIKLANGERIDFFLLADCNLNIKFGCIDDKNTFWISFYGKR